MIPYDIEVYRPEALDELASAYRTATESDLRAAYYGGATELLTQAREHLNRADVWIDYKRVPEAQGIGQGVVPGVPRERLGFGAALRLNELADAAGSGLFGRVAAGIADRSIRNSITLGGNICGMLAYREAVLPFLLLDADVTYFDPAEAKPVVRPLADVFDKRLRLPDGACLLSLSVSRSDAAQLGLFSAERGGPGVAQAGASAASAADHYGAVRSQGRGTGGAWYSARRTADSRVDHPLCTLAAVLLGGELRIALSGAWSCPSRAVVLESRLAELGPTRLGEILDGRGDGGPPEQTAIRGIIAEGIDAESLKFVSDQRGSADYRRHIAANLIEDALRYLVGGNQ